MTDKPQISATALLVTAAVLMGCGQGAAPVKGFVLPEGDPEAGRLAFIELGCNRCHTVAGVELPAFERDRPYDIQLGGEVLRVRSYGDLLTSIVMPDHAISNLHKHQLSPEMFEAKDSPMPDTTTVMTVAQLLNITEFLHAHYEEYTPEYRGYNYVYP